MSEIFAIVVQVAKWLHGADQAWLMYVAVTLLAYATLPLYIASLGLQNCKVRPIVHQTQEWRTRINQTYQWDSVKIFLVDNL